MASSKFLVYVVDDDEVDIRFFKKAVKDGEVLSETEFHLSFNDLEQALTRKCPDLIIMDINMPNCSGIEGLEILKAHSIFRHLPVIMFSSTDLPNDIKKCYEKGAACFVKKPSDPSEFRDLLVAVNSFWSKSINLYRFT